MRASNSPDKNNGHIPASEAETYRPTAEIVVEQDAALRAILIRLGL